MGVHTWQITVTHPRPEKTLAVVAFALTLDLRHERVDNYPLVN